MCSALESQNFHIHTKLSHRRLLRYYEALSHQKPFTFILTFAHKPHTSIDMCTCITLKNHIKYSHLHKTLSLIQNTFAKNLLAFTNMLTFTQTPRQNTTVCRKCSHVHTKCTHIFKKKLSCGCGKHSHKILSH